MNVDVRCVDADWVRSVDFDRGLDGLPRTGSLQILVTHLPELDWRLLHLIAPWNSGLWWLRAYRAYEESSRVALDPYNDPTLVDRYRRQMRKLRVPIHSAWAAHGFGASPSVLQGRLFSTLRRDGRFVRRYQSFFAPESCGDALIEYFLDQMRTFADNCLAEVGDNELLFNASHPPTDDFTLLCLGPSRMSIEQMNMVESRLGALLAMSNPLALHSAIEPGVKFSATIDANAYGLNLVAASSQHGERVQERALSILSLRTQLAIRLAWPPMLEYWLSEWAGEHCWAAEAETIRRLLAQWPVIGQDPLAAAVEP